MTTATMTRAETATIRLDEERYATIDELMQSLRDIGLLSEIVWRMSEAHDVAGVVVRFIRSSDSGEGNDAVPGSIVTMRYGSPLEVVLALLPEAAVTFAAVALAWERITAGVRNLADASLKRAEAQKTNAEADRMLREAEAALDAAQTMPDDEAAKLRAQHAELVKMLAEAHQRLDALESTMGQLNSDDERHGRMRNQLRTALGPDLADRFDDVVSDDELDDVVEAFQRLADKKATIEVEGVD